MVLPLMLQLQMSAGLYDEVRREVYRDKIYKTVLMRLVRKHLAVQNRYRLPKRILTLLVHKQKGYRIVFLLVFGIHGTILVTHTNSIVVPVHKQNFMPLIGFAQHNKHTLAPYHVVHEQKVAAVFVAFRNGRYGLKVG